MQAYNLIWASGVTIIAFILGATIMIFGTPEFLVQEAENSFVASLIVSGIERIGSFFAGLAVVAVGLILAVLCLVSRNDTTGI